MTTSNGFGQGGTPITTFTGSIVGQAALHSVLAKIRDIHMRLISVNQINHSKDRS